MQQLFGLSLALTLLVSTTAVSAQETPGVETEAPAEITPPIDEETSTETNENVLPEETSADIIEEPPLFSVEEIVTALRDMENDTVFTPIAEAFEIPEQLRPIFAAHLTEIFATNEIAADFATYFVTEQGAFGATSREELAGIVRNLGIGWTQETAALGAARLPVADQRRVLEVALATLDHMEDSVCAANTRGALDPAEVAQAEIGYLSTLEPEDLEVYLALTRTALLAEISDDPPFVPMSQTDQRKAGAAYQEVFLKGIDEHPENSLVLEAVNNFDLASDHAICELTKVSLESALSIEGETGDLVVRLLSSG